MRRIKKVYPRVHFFAALRTPKGKGGSSSSEGFAQNKIDGACSAPTGMMLEKEGAGQVVMSPAGAAMPARHTYAHLIKSVPAGTLFSLPVRCRPRTGSPGKSRAGGALRRMPPQAQGQCGAGQVSDFFCLCPPKTRAPARPFGETTCRQPQAPIVGTRDPPIPLHRRPASAHSDRTSIAARSVPEIAVLICTTKRSVEGLRFWFQGGIRT
jgi:hypothetical protein